MTRRAPSTSEWLLMFPRLLHAPSVLPSVSSSPLTRSHVPSAISSIEIGKVPELMEKGIIAGGMIPKVKGMVNAINQGVHEVSIIDGRVLHSVLLENFSDQGSGTLLYKKAE